MSQSVVRSAAEIAVRGYPPATVRRRRPARHLYVAYAPFYLRRSELVGGLRDKEATPVAMDGVPTSLVSIFRRYSDRIREEVYADGATPGHVLKLLRYWVISVGRFSGAPQM